MAAAARIYRNPTFFWQALLILMPILVLSAFGAVFLSQDRALTLRDAADRAQTIADDLASQIWTEITATNRDPQRRFGFETDDAGQLIFPPPLAPVPAAHPFKPSDLNSGQQQLWNTIQATGLQHRALETAVRVCREFIDSHPPAEFAANAQYALGLFLFLQGEYAESERAFGVLLRQFPDATGESGISLRPLAELKLLQLAAGRPISVPATVSVDDLLSNAVCHPDALSPEILRQARSLSSAEEASGTRVQNGLNWQQMWLNQQAVRKLYLAARSFLPTNLSVSLLPVQSNDARPPELEMTPADLSSEPRMPGASGSTGPKPPRMFWFYTPEPMAGPDNRNDFSDGNWLAVHDSARAGGWYAFHSEAELGSWLDLLARQDKQVPDYFGIELEMFGKRIHAPVSDLRVWHHVSWFSPKSPGGGVKKEYSDEIATNILAGAVRSGHGTELLKINIFLTSSTALFEHQQTRAFWLGTLIVASTVAALVGLLAAWHAFKRQQQLTELKSNFVSSVSHELRAPIASVRLMAESLELGKVPGPLKQNEYYHFMVQECRRLSALIENVLDFSRIEQGRKQYEFEPTDLAALTRATVKLMEPYAAEKEVGLLFESATLKDQTEKLEWNVDGRAVQQALVNLIDNAIKHSPKGQAVTVGIEVQNAEGEERAARSDPPNQICNLFVSDHGPGIPLEEHAKIFERFYRRGSELRRETQGVGIGLSLVKHIVEAHGGRVLVESEIGKGSRFTIELRRNDETPNIEH